MSNDGVNNIILNTSEGDWLVATMIDSIEISDYFKESITTMGGVVIDGETIDASEQSAEYEKYVGEEVVVFGTYSGFSGVYELPMVYSIVIFGNGEMESSDHGVTMALFTYIHEKALEVTAELNTTIVNQEERILELEEQLQKYEEVGVSEVEDAGSHDNNENLPSTENEPTMGERNAVSTAKNYLSIMPFSESGLIEQLEYEGYSRSEAEYGVANLGADWMEQAKIAAANYLDIMSFSRSGLIEQLQYEGYTYEQAEYGASSNGY